MDRIERDVYIEAPLARVWTALTAREHLAEWFGDAGAEVDLRPGGRIVFGWHEHGDTHAVIERVEAPHLFSYRWSLRAGVEPQPGSSTLVEFTLAAEGGGTRLRVVESGFEALAGTPEERARHVRANTSGWTAELGELVDYLTRQAV